jgi:hypothetical protein
LADLGEYRIFSGHALILSTKNTMSL